jgi:inhibitor of KinA sporulation pathway (predicted exonuclease)
MHGDKLYLVIDLEATCSRDESVPRAQMEIIEIGAVMVAEDSLEALAEWQSFVRPRIHPTLTDFCRSLTSITQAQVDAAPSFPVAMKGLTAWIDSFSHRGFTEIVFASWGDYDRLQFQQDCSQHAIPYPLPSVHFNIKRGFARALGLRRKFGMAAALEHLGLPLEGSHHRGIDDARNIAKLLPYALGRDA